MKMAYSGMLHRLDIITFYFYEPLLFHAFVPRKFIKTYDLLLSTITFTVNSHTVCFRYYAVWNRFFIRIRAKVFYIQIRFTCETTLLFFLIKSMVYRKNTLYKKKFSSFYMLYVHDSHAI